MAIGMAANELIVLLNKENFAFTLISDCRCSVVRLETRIPFQGILKQTAEPPVFVLLASFLLLAEHVPTVVNLSM